MDFGDKVQILRKKHGISQESLANILNVNRNYLSRIETGKSEPSLSTIKDIALFFNVDINSLIGIDQTNSINIKDKKKIIMDNCNYLLESDLDFIIKLTSIMREEFLKK